MERTKKRRTRYTPEQARASEKEMVEQFDLEFPVGAIVDYWKTLPFGPVVRTKIRHSAWIIGGSENEPGNPICKVEGVGGGVSIFHIKAPVIN